MLTTACSKSELDVLYSNCLDIGVKEQMVGMEESDRYSVKKGVEMGCEIVKKECTNTPDGEMCSAFRKKFNAL